MVLLLNEKTHKTKYDRNLCRVILRNRFLFYDVKGSAKRVKIFPIILQIGFEINGHFGSHCLVSFSMGNNM